MTTIKLHNTKTRKREEFVPIDPKNVRMYLCGPTVYDRAHLGNARPVLVFDVLNRLLRHVYGEESVTYVRNFTDVDDKINETAQKRKAAGAEGTLEELIHQRSDETIEWYHNDMDALGALRPDHEPRATEYISEMISMIKTLVKKGYAYSKPIAYGHNSRAVYFNKEKAPEHNFFKVKEAEAYGTLSGRSLDEMIAGSRAEVGEGKENPMDFVLWKPSTSNEPGWESPWGFGRPGWHIECSAMAKALLGDTFDIHGGGLDLQFPHHENEIAQSCCANDTDFMANYWLHNEMLQVEGKKMSKSLGNFFTVRDLLDQGVPGEVIRFVMLSTHYRKPMDWTDIKARVAQAQLQEWYSLVSGVSVYQNNRYAGAEFWGVDDAIADDLNTSKAISILHRVAQRAKKEGTQQSKRELLSAANFLGFLLDDPAVWSVEDQDLTRFAEQLNSLRAEARKTKSFADADGFRDALLVAGVEVKVTSVGVELQASSSFDPAKLEGLL